MQLQGSVGTPGLGGPRYSFDLISRDELQRLVYDQGMSDAEIATMYGVTANRVHERRRKMNLVQGQITSEQLAEMVRLGEDIKRLPWEAIQEIREVVQRYQQ